MSARFAEVVGVLPQTCAPSLSREERTRKIVVGPMTMGLESFEAQFNKETMIESRKKGSKQNDGPAHRYVVQFTVRRGSNTPAAISPTEALSLSWVPKEWLKMSQPPAKIVEVPAAAAEAAAELQLAGT